MIKVRIQLVGESGGSTNPFVVGSQLVKEGGFLSLYKGLSAGILRQLTYGMSRLGIFRTLTNNFTEIDPATGKAKPLSPITNLGCSVVAGGLGALIGTPADAALIRMQADSTLPKDQRRNYKNGVDALVRMAREEGLKGFFSGATPTVIRGLSMNVGMLASYDPLKRITGSWFGDGTSASLVSAGFLSGWCASTVALPFDFVKTRMQKMRPDANGVMPYSSFFDASRKIAAKEGLGAFYAGYPTFVIRIAPHITFTWIFMEYLNGLEMLK